MIKKISSLIVAFMMVFSVCTAFAVQVDWTDDERIAMLLGETVKTETVEEIDIIQALLYRLGIISDPSTLNKDAKLATGDFLKAIAEISGAVSTDNADELYSQLKAGGYVNVSSVRGNVTMDNALYSAVILTNRERDAEAHGGYPYGYYFTANQMKLLNNINYNGKAKLTVAEALQLYYNIISADKRVLSEVGESGAYYSDKNTTTILEEKYHVTLKKGILTGANLTGLYGPSSLKENEIAIDRVTYEYAGDMTGVCVGARVAAFVQKDVGDDRGTVLCFEPYKTQITEFRSADVEEYDDTSLTLENEEEISYDNPRVIFNGTYYGYLEDNLETFLNLDATITAIDNNDDDSAEVLNIVGYEHFVVAVDVGELGSVTFKNNATFNGKGSAELLSDSDLYVEITKNGKAIEPEEILGNNVISLAMSGNKSGKKYLKVKVSDAKVSGIVEEIFNDGAFERVTVDGKSYRNMAKNSTVTAKVGKSYVFLLSDSGDIVDLTESSAGLKWGFLTKYDAETGLDESAQLKIFTQDGNMQMIEIADKAKYFDAANQNGVKLTGRQIAEKLSAGSISRVPVRYMLNSDAEISELYVPIDNTDNHLEPDEYPCLYSKNMVNGRFYNMKFLTSSGSYFMENDGFVFAIPGADNDQDDLYRITTLAKEGSNENYTVKLYNADRFGVCQVAVLESEEQSMDDHYMLRVIDKVTKGVNSKGDDILKLHVWNANGITDSGVSSKDILEVHDLDMLCYDNDSGWIKNVKISELKYGDVIAVTQDDLGRVTRFRLMFRASDPGQIRMQDVHGSRVTDGSENIDSVGVYFAYATLVEYGSSNSGNVYLKYNVGTEETPIYYINQLKNQFGTGVIYRINTAAKKTTKISMGDLKPGDKIITYRSWGGMSFVAVVE